MLRDNNSNVLLFQNTTLLLNPVQKFNSRQIEFTIDIFFSYKFTSNELALCLGINLKSSGAGPSKRSLNFTQSDALGLAINDSNSSRPVNGGARSLIFCGKTSSTPTGIYLWREYNLAHNLSWEAL